MSAGVRVGAEGQLAGGWDRPPGRDLVPEGAARRPWKETRSGVAFSWPGGGWVGRSVEMCGGGDGFGLGVAVSLSGEQGVWPLRSARHTDRLVGCVLWAGSLY